MGEDGAFSSGCWNRVAGAHCSVTELSTVKDTGFSHPRSRWEDAETGGKAKVGLRDEPVRKNTGRHRRRSRREAAVCARGLRWAGPSAPPGTGLSLLRPQRPAQGLRVGETHTP